MAVDLHVVVDVYASLLPVCVFETGRRQRPQRRALDLLEERTTALAVTAHLATVQVDEQFPQPRIQRTQRVEDFVAHTCEQPSLRDLHSDLHLRLVAWMERTCW